LKTVPDGVEITLPHHQTASLLVVGKGPPAPPSSPAGEQERLATLRDSLFPIGKPGTQPKPSIPHPDLGDLTNGRIRIRGTHLGEKGKVTVSMKQSILGTLSDAKNSFDWQLPAGALPSGPLTVSLTHGDEGTWFLVQAIDLLVQRRDGKWVAVASWIPSDAEVSSGKDGECRYPLQWREPVEVTPSTARYEGRESKTSGAWKSRYGKRAAWIPNVSGMAPQSGYRLEVDGTAFAWDSSMSDPRALEAPRTAATRSATCWFGDEAVSCVLTPPDSQPYRVSLYLLDYDRNGRANRIELSDEAGVLANCVTSKQENALGTYVSWKVTGPVRVKLTKQAGFNVALSGVFVDAATPP
jgi:hypothetical protein